MATWLLPTPGGASTRKTRGAAGSSSASASASASVARSRACSGRGVAPVGKCASRSGVSGDGAPSGRVWCRIVSWGHGGESGTHGVSVLGRRPRGGRRGPGAPDPRPRPPRPAGLDAAEGHARPGRVERGGGAAGSPGGDGLAVRDRPPPRARDVLVPARRPAGEEDGALVPHAADREGRRPRPRSGRG